MKTKKLHIIFILVVLVTMSLHSTCLAYDWNQSHVVTQYFYADRSATADIEKSIWQALRQAGCTEECAAGVMGNIWRESHYDPTLVQGMKKSWSGSYGTNNSVGLGLCQWTDSGRKSKLAASADELGCQWTDIRCQVKLLVEEINDDHWCKTYHNGGYSFNSAQEFKECTDMKYACGAFCYNWERPGHPAFQERLQYAQEAYDKFKGTAIEGAEQTQENGEDGDEEVTLHDVTPESQLVGVKEKSKLLEGIKEIIFTDDSSLNSSESYSVQNIRQDIEDSKSDYLFNLIRTGICFIGMMLIFIPIFLILCAIFDKANSFIEVSALGAITFGKITAVDDELADGCSTCVTKGHFIKVIIVLMVVGMLLVSGSIFSLIAKPLILLSTL